MILEAISLLEYNYLYQIKDLLFGTVLYTLFRPDLIFPMKYMSLLSYDEITIAFGTSGKYLSMHAIILCMGNGRYEHFFK